MNVLSKPVRFAHRVLFWILGRDAEKFSSLAVFFFFFLLYQIASMYEMMMMHECAVPTFQFTRPCE
jgi:hypothetical protein